MKISSKSPGLDDIFTLLDDNVARYAKYCVTLQSKIKT